MNYNGFEKKVAISATLTFDTAFHIGSGKEGELAADMGVMKDHKDKPVLPGSTIKGCFRSTVEKLAHHLKNKEGDPLKACMLDTKLSEVSCVSDENYRKSVLDDFQNLDNERAKLDWLKSHTCDVCQLFGSPVQASRIFFTDGKLKAESGFQVRDGVVIDRDSGTARDGFKFDYEVAARDTAFELTIETENPTTKDLALIAAGIAEWRQGVRIGGFTSRGLGHATLKTDEIKEVDFSVTEKLQAYLLERKMDTTPKLLDEALEKALNGEV